MSMSNKKKEILKEEQEWERIDGAVMESGRFLAKYQKQLLIGVGAILALVCIYFAYDAFYVQPKTAEAQVALYKGELYFQEGRDSLALNGNGNDYLGLEAIISEYGSTKPGNLAKAYAGLIYSRTGKYDQALPYLKDYNGSDKIFAHLVKGAIGDCLANTDKVEESVSYFLEAAKGLDSDLYSPIFYKKAAMSYRELKQYDKVAETYTMLKNKYSTSMEGMEADKYIEEANMLKGK